jgi:hypothetical protein
MTTRKAITIFDEDTAITLVKPFSGNYDGQLFVIHEDAYGEAVGIMTPIEQIRKNFGGTTEEFDEILRQL